MRKYIYILLLLTVFTITSHSSGTEEEQGNTIRFWHVFGDENRSGWIQDRADEWNQMQDEYTLLPEFKGSYRETLNAAILASRQGEAPHLVQIFEVGSQLALDSGIFRPVRSVYDFDTSDYIDSVLNYYTIDGQVNSIPFNSSSPVLYYNKDLMRQAGLDPEKPPLTLEEVIEYSEIAKNKGIAAAGFGFNLHSWFFEQWVAEQGGTLANNDNGRSARATEVTLQSREFIRIATLIKELNDKGLYKYTGRLEDWSGSDAIFTEGQVMFHVTSTADIGNIAQAVEGKFELGTSYFPIPEGTRNGTVVGGASVWLTKDHSDEALRAAIDFLLYMTNTENMASWHKLTGYYPVRKSSIELLEEENWFENNKNRTIAFTQLLETRSNNATAGALIGSFLDTRTIIEEAIQKILNGEAVNTVLAEAEEQANTKLQEYNQNL